MQNSVWSSLSAEKLPLNIEELESLFYVKSELLNSYRSSGVENFLEEWKVQEADIKTALMTLDDQLLPFEAVNQLRYLLPTQEEVSEN